MVFRRSRVRSPAWLYALSPCELCGLSIGPPGPRASICACPVGPAWFRADSGTNLITQWENVAVATAQLGRSCIGTVIRGSVWFEPRYGCTFFSAYYIWWLSVGSWRYRWGINIFTFSLVRCGFGLTRGRF